jgi:hypothetical protein
MNLKPLSKEETKSLEHRTVPYEHIRAEGFRNKAYTQMFHLQREIKIVEWYHYHGLEACGSIYLKWRKLTELFGYKPSYYVSYEYKNAVWGFEWEGEKFLIYESIRGLSIQILPTFMKKKLERFQKELIRILYKEKP